MELTSYNITEKEMEISSNDLPPKRNTILITLLQLQEPYACKEWIQGRIYYATPFMWRSGRKGGRGDEVEKESMNIRNILVYLYRPPRAVTKGEKEKKN